MGVYRIWENLEIWSALGAILGLLRVSSYIKFTPYIYDENRLFSYFIKKVKSNYFFINTSINFS